MNVEGTHALVTGASSGIGASLAETLARHGATVGIVARRKDRLEEVLQRCQAHAPESRVWVADLGDVPLAEKVALEAWDTFGGLDILVNNAAIPKVKAVTDLTVDDLERVMRINFTSPAAMTLAVLPRMLERDRGCIVNVGSMGGRMGIHREAAYSASKFALTGFSESLAVELHGTGVSVKLIQPGPIDTEIWSIPGEEHASYDGPLVPPQEVADGIIDAIGSAKFEHFLPDMKWVVDSKQKDIDGFMAGVAQMAKQQRQQQGGQA
jgi:short-subunit dehydrogenase